MSMSSLHRTMILAFGLLAAAGSNAQEAISEAALRGTWLVSGSSIKESLTFLPDGEFTTTHTQTKKDGKAIPPLVRTGEGAYKLAPSACSMGQKTGNLWLVKESQRCCFVAYTIGKMLVLDEIQGSSSFPFSLCQSKTLKRGSDKGTK